MNQRLIEIASNVSTPLALAGLIVALLFLLAKAILKKQNGGQTDGIKVALRVFNGFLALASLCVVLGFSGFVISSVNENSFYSIKVTILTEDNHVVNDCQLVSSLGGELKKTSYGWEVELAVDRVEKDDSLTLYVEKTATGLTGSSKVHLGNKLKLKTSVILRKSINYGVTGQVVDQMNRSVVGVNVTSLRSGVTTKTNDDGIFHFDSLGMKGDEVVLHFEKNGYKSIDEWLMIGAENKVQLRVNED